MAARATLGSRLPVDHLFRYGARVVDIQLLRDDHAAALLAFEQENRAYFAASIPDRGDDYFANFADRHQALLDEQAAGTCLFHVITASDGSIIGRVNLVDVVAGEAELGYRIAEGAAGRGLATRAVAQLLDRAVSEYGLTKVRAATTRDNPASQRILDKVGFVVVGHTTLSGHPGIRYECDLVPAS